MGVSLVKPSGTGIRKILKRWRHAARARKLESGRIAQKSIDSEAVLDLVSATRSNTATVPLIRIGGEGDGGYLLPDDLDGIRHCFSPGVDVTARFEDEIARRHGIRCFMADASVERAPLDNPLFEFDAKFLGAHRDETFITLGDWVNDKLGNTADDDMLLQMDIEGGEFDVLIESDSALLRRFRIMVIEFHGMERIFERHSLPLIRALFAKLHRDFAIVHMHANNCCGIAMCRGLGIPRVFEFTYLRRDRLPEGATTGRLALPHTLDIDNVPASPPIIMPDIWWRA